MLESPLSPMVISWFTSTYFTVPIKREADFVQLFTIAVDIVHSGDGRVLSGLYSVLFCRKSICVISHRVQHVETLQAFVTGVNITGYVSQRMSYVQSGSRRIREHIQYVEFLFAFVFSHLIGMVLCPSLLPFLFNLSEIVFHDLFLLFNIFVIKWLQR